MQPEPPDGEPQSDNESSDVNPQLDTALHLRLQLEGGARPSTYESSRAALLRIRARRALEREADRLA